MTPKRPALLPVELWEQLSEPLQVVLSARFCRKVLDEDEQDYRSLLSMQPMRRTVPPAFETLHRWAQVVLCESRA